MRSSTAGVRPSSWTLFRDQRDQVAPGDEMPTDFPPADSSQGQAHQACQGEEG